MIVIIPLKEYYIHACAYWNSTQPIKSISTIFVEESLM